MEFRYQEVWRRISDTVTGAILEWNAVVAFSPDRKGIPILGHAGFLEFLMATFYGDAKHVDLSPETSIAAFQRSPMFVH
jgi:hypothetical protein